MPDTPARYTYRHTPALRSAAARLALLLRGKENLQLAAPGADELADILAGGLAEAGLVAIPAADLVWEHAGGTLCVAGFTPGLVCGEGGGPVRPRTARSAEPARPDVEREVYDRIHAAISDNYAGTPVNPAAVATIATAAVMSMLTDHANSHGCKHGDLRQPMAVALAAAFTRPIPRMVKGRPTDELADPHPADRVHRTMSVHFTAGDGHPSFRMVTCNEAAEVCAAVRDDKLAAALESIDDLNDLIRQERVIHIETIRRAEQAGAALARVRSLRDHLATATEATETGALLLRVARNLSDILNEPETRPEAAPPAPLTPPQLDAIRRRSAAEDVTHEGRHFLPGAQLDRRALLAEVNHLQAALARIRAAIAKPVMCGPNAIPSVPASPIRAALDDMKEIDRG